MPLSAGAAVAHDDRLAEVLAAAARRESEAPEALDQGDEFDVDGDLLALGRREQLVGVEVVGGQVRHATASARWRRTARWVSGSSAGSGIQRTDCWRYHSLIHTRCQPPAHASAGSPLRSASRRDGFGWPQRDGLKWPHLAADERLWEISELARRLDVADAILELPAEAALGRLAQTFHGREVLGELDDYLRHYGGRSRLHELSEPRDAERPGLALQSVRLMLERPVDLPAERRARAAERDALEAATLARVGDRAAFADLLARVKAAAPLEETHAYHIDYPGLQATREALLGFGRRLVAEGRLDAAADVFVLGRERLREALADPWGEPLQPLARDRWTELERARATVPAPYLGPAPDPAAEVPAMVAKFYGTPGSARRDGDVLHGIAASRGTAAGIARIVRGPDDFARVAAGDVMVCTTTTPAWTPLFGAIAALVTDTGGILCHAAVVAREYGLPAVVGAGAATAAIPDGARVEVDGGAGRVRIVCG